MNKYIVTIAVNCMFQSQEINEVHVLGSTRRVNDDVQTRAFGNRCPVTIKSYEGKHEINLVVATNHYPTDTGFMLERSLSEDSVLDQLANAKTKRYYIHPHLDNKGESHVPAIAAHIEKLTGRPDGKATINRLKLINSGRNKSSRYVV